jgi:hypothetical protein
MKLSKLLFIIVPCALTFCGDPEPTKESFRPQDIDQFVHQLIFDGTVESGAPPDSTKNALTALKIVAGPKSVSVAHDSHMFIPLSIHEEKGFDGVYIQLSNEFDEFSDSYYKIPLTQSSDNDTLKMLKFGIPENIEPGLFFMNVAAYNGDSVSLIHSFPVEIIRPQTNCDESGSNFLTGEEQFANRTYYFDESAFPKNNFGVIESQRLSFKANLFTSADRIDVYVDKQWVGGTGTILAYGVPPPVTKCTALDAADNGFVPGARYLSFEIMPDQRIDVFVNGCLGVSAWEYGFLCPRK